MTLLTAQPRPRRRSHSHHSNDRHPFSSSSICRMSIARTCRCRDQLHPKCWQPVQGYRIHQISIRARRQEYPLPPGHHVVVWSSNTVKISHVLHRSRRTPPEHSGSATGQVSDLVRANVLFTTAMPEISNSRSSALSDRPAERTERGLTRRDPESGGR